MTSVLRPALGWLAVAVPGPLLFFDSTHRWEEDQSVAGAAWWGVVTVPLLGAVLSFRTRRVVPSAVAGVALAGVALAVFRWVIPLQGDAPWPALGAAGAVGAALGAVAGRLVPARRPPPPEGRRAWVFAGLAVIAGMFLMPTTVQLGAEDSTVAHDEGRYGATGTVTLPSAGRYAILAVGFAPIRPDCTVGPPPSRSASRVTVPPSDYGGDAATYKWVATFTVPAPGTYEVNCRSSADYVVGDVPTIRGAVSSMIHWPSAVIWLLGSLPGGVLAVSTWHGTRRRPRVSA